MLMAFILGIWYLFENKTRYSGILLSKVRFQINSGSQMEMTCDLCGIPAPDALGVYAANVDGSGIRMPISTLQRAAVRPPACRECGH